MWGENSKITDDNDDFDETLYAKIIGRLRLADVIITIKLVHFILLWLYPTSGNPITSILNVDFISLCNIDNAIQIQGFLFVASVNLYYSRMLFVHFHPFFLSLFEGFLFGPKLDKVFLTPLVYRGVSIKKRIQRNALYTILGMQLFLLAIDLVLLLVQVKGLAVIVTNGNYFEHWHIPLTGWRLNRLGGITVALIYFEFFWALMAFVGFFIAYIATLAFTLFCVSITTGFILFGQTNEWCRKMLCSATRVWLTKHLLAILRHNRRSLVLMLRQTTYFSNEFLVFMSINIPFNCHILGTILFGKPNQSWIPFMIIFMAQQWIVIFGCHILCVRINRAPFKSNKLLLHLSARRRFSTRATLTLAIYLQTFYTKKGYGFRYGKLGLITIGTFVKFLLLYGEFIMYACMIVKG